MQKQPTQILASLTGAYCKLPQKRKLHKPCVKRETLQTRHSDFHLVAILAFQLLTFSSGTVLPSPAIRT